MTATVTQAEELENKRSSTAQSATYENIALNAPRVLTDIEMNNVTAGQPYTTDWIPGQLPPPLFMFNPEANPYAALFSTLLGLVREVAKQLGMERRQTLAEMNDIVRHLILQEAALLWSP